eukprot:m.154101 g.154101  ORF g.154101 m.154101 type:complete len:131 (-) comp14363_c0_seq6:1705-2097(-)
MVSLLLTLGCDCDAKNNHGDTPIMRAATAGHIPVVSELVASNASIDKTNNAGYTALVLATIYNRPGVVNFLLSAKANCELRDKVRLKCLIKPSCSLNPPIFRTTTRLCFVQHNLATSIVSPHSEMGAPTF